MTSTQPGTAANAGPNQPTDRSHASPRAVTALSVDLLAPALLLAPDTLGGEAAIELLIAHEVWLRRSDFIDALVDYDDISVSPPEARIYWQDIPAFVDQARCSTSDAAILRIATELAGTDTGWSFAELLDPLDERNRGYVADAVSYALDRGGQW